MLKVNIDMISIIDGIGTKIEDLDYRGEGSQECLTDEDVRTLANSFLKNNCFKGPLDLSNNNLTDLVRNFYPMIV